MATDRNDAPPRLRKDMNYATFSALPAWSTGPSAELSSILPALKARKVEGVQARSLGAYQAAGFKGVGHARVIEAEDILAAAQTGAEQRLEMTCLHLGHGFESNTEALNLGRVVLEAQERFQHPMCLETHRGTITQDMRRTLDLIETFPDLRFNADLTHWYSGQEMVYGDFEAKLDRLEPVFERVVYIHGRMCDSGSFQRSPAALAGLPALEHFQAMWRRCFRAFLRRANAGDVLPFAAELLPAVVDLDGRTVHLNYARLVPGPDGAMREESDRWADAEALWEIAAALFEAERTGLSRA